MKNAHQPPPATEPVIEDEDLKWEIAWQKHKSKVLVGAAAVVVGLVGWGSWAALAESSAKQEQNTYAEAADAAAWQAIVNASPRSQAAGNARFRLAATYREQGQWAESTAEFQAFLKDFPNHPLAGAALLGVAQNQAATGEVATSLATDQQVAERYPQSYAAPFALFSRAQTLLQDFRREEARSAFQSIQTTYPFTIIANIAASQVQRMGEELPVKP